MQTWKTVQPHLRNIVKPNYKRDLDVENSATTLLKHLKRNYKINISVENNETILIKYIENKLYFYKREIH